MTTKDIKNPLPSENILNTTLVTQVEVIENGVVKYYNFSNSSKVYVMLEDTHRTMRIIINKHKQHA